MCHNLRKRKPNIIVDSKPKAGKKFSYRGLSADSQSYKIFFKGSGSLIILKKGKTQNIWWF
jgi:hypothetical protein